MAVLSQADKSAASRKRILKGAIRAFAQKGYHGTSMRSISNVCQLEQSSIYHHFGSKENLFRHALIHAHSQVIRYIERHTNLKEGLKEELDSIFRAILAYHNAHADQVFLIFSLVYSAPREITNEYTSIYGGDFRRFVEAAFRRCPPSTRASERQSIVIDILHSFLLSLSAVGAKNDRVLMYKRSLRLALYGSL